MATFNVGALFYPKAFAPQQLQKLVTGLIEESTLGLDVVTFEEEEGGIAERELAIPFLAGMDEVVVDSARLRLAAHVEERELLSFAVQQKTGTDAGLLLTLERPERLSKVVIDAPAFGAGSLQANLHLVVRTAEKGQPGPPIFADPSFSVASPMYAPILGGLVRRSVAGNRLQLEFPGTSGTGWLIQFASGTEATALQPQPFTSAVRSVRVLATPRNLTLVAPGEEEDADDVVLWSYANQLLPDVGAQEVDFTPIAQKRLAARLEAVEPGAGDVTLPVPLRFESESFGSVVIRAKTLTARYRVFPLGPDPKTVRLGTGWTSLLLEAPAARRPESGTARIVGRHLRRDLNPGSAEPPLVPPRRGLVAGAERWIAAPVPFEPVDDRTELPLVAVQALVEADDDAEAALEVRRDVAGGPGSPYAPPVVRQLKAGTLEWVEFELAEPLKLEPPVPVWISLRTTKGEVRWFTAGAPEGRVSRDRGATWAAVDPLLAPAGTPLVGLLHESGDPLAVPRVSIVAGSRRIELDLSKLTPADPAEFAPQTDAVQASLLDALGATLGTGRATTQIQLFSRAVLDLTVDGLAVSYDPLAAAV